MLFRFGIKEVPVYVALLPLCAHRAGPHLP